MYGGCLGNGNRFVTKTECEDTCGKLGKLYDTGAETTEDTSQNGLSEISAVPVEVANEMRRITILYAEHYRKYCYYRSQTIRRSLTILNLINVYWNDRFTLHAP